MHANLVIDLLARKAAEATDAGMKAGRNSNYIAAMEKQIEVRVLLDLQKDIKALINEAAKPDTIAAMIKDIVAPPRRAPAKAPAARKPKITQPKRDFSSGKDWSLDDTLRPGDIDKILGQGSAAKGKVFRCADDTSKVKFSWRFVVDGKECAIWDYHGTRWSGFGPKECFEALGIRILDR